MYKQGGNWPSGSNQIINQLYQHQGRRPDDSVFKLVRDLTIAPKERTEALQTLSVQREQIPDLAVYLWYSPGTMTALVSELISIYPYLSSHTINDKLANRVCNVLALLQCVAGHEETRLHFVNSNIPMYLFPFLHATNQSREFEYFKLTSLGIIGSLVKSEQPEIIDYLLQSEFVPLCLRILKFGQEISKTVAAFIIQKILCDESGRNSICSSKEKLDTVLNVLNHTLVDLSKSFSARLSKHVIGSYTCLLGIPEVKRVALSMDLSTLRHIEITQAADAGFKEFVKNLLEEASHK